MRTTQAAPVGGLGQLRCSTDLGGSDLGLEGGSVLVARTLPRFRVLMERSSRMLYCVVCFKPGINYPTCLGGCFVADSLSLRTVILHVLHCRELTQSCTVPNSESVLPLRHPFGGNCSLDVAALPSFSGSVPLLLGTHVWVDDVDLASMSRVEGDR